MGELISKNYRAESQEPAGEVTGDQMGVIDDIDSVNVLQELNELLEIAEQHKNSNPAYIRVLKGAARVISRGLQLRWQWVHVSKRLPIEDGEYLIATKNGLVDCAFFTDDLEEYAKDDFSDQGHRPGFFKYDTTWGNYEISSVVAWMPKPEFP